MTAAKTFRNLLAGSRAWIAPALFNPLAPDALMAGPTHKAEQKYARFPP